MFGPKTKFAQQLHSDKYRGKNEDFRGMATRVAGALTDDNQHYLGFRDTLLEQRFCPAGRIQTGAGSSKSVTLYNCYVLPTIEDSLVQGENSIMSVATKAAATMRKGGGVGYDFSTLRPRGDLIKKLHSSSSGPISFMGIFDAICKTISSSGHRRGAQMGVLNCSHPDIEEFVRCKADLSQLTGFNISVGITDEFMEAVISNSDFDLRFNGTIYNTIRARDLWNQIMCQTWDNAEPGILFLDTINRWNNLWYCEDIVATNPCLVQGSLVSTPMGLIPVEDIKEGDTIDVVGGVGEVETVYRYENKEVFKVTLSDGSEVTATPAHIFHTIVGGSKKFTNQVKLKDLSIGDKVRLTYSSMPSNACPETNLSDRDLGLIVGTVIGDGCFTHTINGACKVSFGKSEELWKQEVYTLFSKLGDCSIQECTKSTDVVYSRPVGELLDNIGLKRGKSTEKFLPDNLLNTNRDFLAGYLDGLFSTDGNVNMNSSNPCIRVASSCKKSLIQAKRALSMFGILSRVYPSRKKGSKNIIEGREVTRTSDSYTLVVLGSGIRIFNDNIGFTNKYKQDRLSEMCSMYNLTGCMWTATIKSIEPAGTATVYDLFEPTTDTWIAEGIVHRGCAEQPLPPNGACLLGSFNMTKYVNGSGWNLSQLIADIPHVVRALDNVVDVSEYPIPEQELEAKNKRRMGIGVLGMANAIETMGPLYGSPEYIDLQGQVLEVIRDETYRASVELAKEKGSFPLFDVNKYMESKFIKTLPKDIQEGIKKYGIRNSHLTSIAPTGTISMCCDNVSSGIEPVFSYTQDRTIQTFEGAIQVKLEDYAYARGVKGKRSQDVTVQEHLNVLANAQMYVDSAVSKTCNVGDSVTFDEFKDIYMRAWETGCKGCTTFRAAGKRFGVLNSTDDEEGQSCTFDPETGKKTCE